MHSIRHLAINHQGKKETPFKDQKASEKLFYYGAEFDFGLTMGMFFKRPDDTFPWTRITDRKSPTKTIVVCYPFTPNCCHFKSQNSTQNTALINFLQTNLS